jgi:hypothetical protein
MRRITIMLAAIPICLILFVGIVYNYGYSNGYNRANGDSAESSWNDLAHAPPELFDTYANTFGFNRSDLLEPMTVDGFQLYWRKDHEMVGGDTAWMACKYAHPHSVCWSYYELEIAIEQVQKYTIEDLKIITQ